MGSSQFERDQFSRGVTGEAMMRTSEEYKAELFPNRHPRRGVSDDTALYVLNGPMSKFGSGPIQELTLITI
jgi:hypothetical protein